MQGYKGCSNPQKEGGQKKKKQLRKQSIRRTLFFVPQNQKNFSEKQLLASEFSVFSYIYRKQSIKKKTN